MYVANLKAEFRQSLLYNSGLDKKREKKKAQCKTKLYIHRYPKSNILHPYMSQNYIDADMFNKSKSLMFSARLKINRYDGS